jgi:Flp pilus assembly protein TadG
MGVRSQFDLQSSRSQRRRLALRLGGDNGGALVEMAMVVAFLGAPLVLGTAEIGSLVNDSIEISGAANAGALYGMRSSTLAADTAGMTAAAQSEASDFGAKLTVTPMAYYACSLAVDGTQYTGTNALTNATTNCTGGSNHPLEFIQVSTSAVVTPAVQCPGLPKTLKVAGFAVMEVEQ